MTDPVWEIKSPGVLWLPPTGMEIARIEIPSLGLGFSRLNATASGFLANGE